MQLLEMACGDTLVQITQGRNKSPTQNVRSRMRANSASLHAGPLSHCAFCENLCRTTNDRKPMQPRIHAAPCGAASTIIPLRVYRTPSRGCATALAWLVQTAHKRSARTRTSRVPHALPCLTHGALLNLRALTCDKSPCRGQQPLHAIRAFSGRLLHRGPPRRGSGHRGRLPAAMLFGVEHPVCDRARHAALAAKLA